MSPIVGVLLGLYAIFGLVFVFSLAKVAGDADERVERDMLRRMKDAEEAAKTKVPSDVEEDG